MDTIGKVSEGIIEICWDCGHIERLSQFKRDPRHQRTRAARATNTRSRGQHGGAPVTLIPKSCGLMAQSIIEYR